MGSLKAILGGKDTTCNNVFLSHKQRALWWHHNQTTGLHYHRFASSNMAAVDSCRSAIHACLNDGRFVASPSTIRFIRLSYTEFDSNLLSAETEDGNDIVATTSTSWFPNWTTQCSLNIYKKHPTQKKRSVNIQCLTQCNRVCLSLMQSSK
jgi:hypothetical protein